MNVMIERDKGDKTNKIIDDNHDQMNIIKNNNSTSNDFNEYLKTINNKINKSCSMKYEQISTSPTIYNGDYNSFDTNCLL